MRKSTLSALIAATLLGSAVVGNANAFSITSGGSTLTGNRLGLNSWNVGGTNQLSSQTLWFNTGGTSLNEELASFVTPYGASPTYTESGSASSSTSSYTGVSGFDVGVTYSIASSTLTETFNVTNTTGSAAVFNLFQFTDFDLTGYHAYNPTANNVGNGTNGFNYGQSDTVSAVGSTITQTNGGITITATGTPTFVTLGQFLPLEDGLFAGTIAANSTPFTGDAAYIYAYQFNLAAGASAQVVTATSAVPVPAAIWLFGSGLLGLVGIARRRA